MNYIFTEGTGIIFQPNYVYIYNRKNNTFDIFNETCGDFIKLFDGERGENDIVENITSIYEVENKSVYNDLDCLIEYLIDRHYLSCIKDSFCYPVPIELEDNSETTKLVNVEIEYTNQCNLKCKYCYAETNSGKPEISLKQWVNLLNILYDQGLRSVTFSGGEPFIRRDFIKLVEEVRNLFVITINTNGTLIDSNISKYLGEYNLKCVQVSIDSIDPKAHDSMRGQGSWQKAMNSLFLLKKYNIPVRISSTISAQNELDLPKLKAYCEQNNFEFSPETLKPCGYAKILPKEYFSSLTDKEISTAIPFPIDTFDTPCQASLGFAAIGCDGLIKPCNLPNTFFHTIAPDTIQEHDGRWYHQLPVFNLVKKSCDNEAITGPKINPKIHYEYSQCVLERYKKAQSTPVNDE